ncbi:MAG TPA: S41 family peptidase, partial [Ramlibacter sp.]|nr:S41 family peptidase [Ramlibacter sp.]
DPPPSTRFGASSQFAGICDLGTQKRWVRSYMDEVYYWYSEIPEVDASRFSEVSAYFDALLVRTPDAAGLPKDQWSTVLPTLAARALVQPASAQLQAAPLPVLSSHTGLVSQPKLVPVAGGRVVGYLEFKDHDTGAQDDLITAFQQLQREGVQDLILDLRSNSGGFLYIALAAASMVTGPASSGKVFEHLQFNDKRAARTARSVLNFSSTLQFGESQYLVGTPLPQLGLPRLFVLTTGSTCSASESIINSLRGIDVQVILIGDTTCGKPFGFERKDNCGLAYFPIEFKGTNAKGFGDYTAGFSPTCRENDDLRPTNVAPGEPGDPLLEGAKHYIENGSCRSGTAVQSAALPKLTARQQPSRPAWEGRVLPPQLR